MKRIIAWVEGRIRASTKLHKVGLRTPEEDEYLLLHTASTIIVGLYLAVPEMAAPYVFFDRDIPPQEQARVMAFYAGCVRRHLHAHRFQGHFLSKNPYFTPKIGALSTTFSDARFIVLVRNPLNVIPSYTSLSSLVQRILYGKKALDNHEYILTATQHWYRYPQERLAGAPDASFIEVKFEDMVRDPQKTVAAIYRHLGFEISPDFARILREETERARHYRSQHQYSIAALGYTREQILTLYADVFEQWNFDRGD